MNTTIEDLKKAIRTVPDFPKKGIMFKDITTALKDPKVFKFIIDELYEYYKDLNITKIVTIESRGFIAGSALAYKLDAGFIPVRKAGKLPADIYSKSYDLEYGTDTLEIHKDALNENDVILMHDDLLATGGTALATLDLISLFNVKKVYTSFICDLSFLEGMKKLKDNHEVFSLISF